MTIALRGTPTVTHLDTGSSLVQNVPTGVVDGDLLIWRVSETSATLPASTPVGWTVLKTGTTTATCMAVYYRVAASEPASYTQTMGASGRCVGVMTAYSGVDNVTPLDVVVPAFVVGTTTITCPAITPVTAGAWVVGFSDNNVASGVLGTTISSSNTTIDGQDTSAASAATNNVGATSHFAWTSGAFTPAFTSSNASVRSVGGTAALRPAAGATNVNGDVSIALTDTVTSAGVVGKAVGVALALTVGITAAGTVGGAPSGGSSVTETVTIASAGVVGTSAGSSIPLADTITSAGVVGKSSDTAIPLTDTIASTGVVGKSTGTSVPLTATIAAAGTVAGTGGSSGASIPLTDTIASAGVVGRQTGTSLSETASVVSAGIVGAATGTTRPLTATVTAAGQVGLSSGSAVSVTIAVASAGQVGTVGSVSRPLTVTITAAGSVSTGGPSIPFALAVAPTQPQRADAAVNSRAVAAGVQPRAVTAPARPRRIEA